MKLTSESIPYNMSSFSRDVFNKAKYHVNRPVFLTIF
ncbi:hypothetical protein V462_04800 [Pantoea ananatis 15320]|nr:hypothetical protein V462_04800 [Pantoea ananatis 15320]